jgi:hypothetical protein
MVSDQFGEAKDFASAQPTPGGQQDSGPVSGRDGLNERDDLGGGRYRAFLRAVGARTVLAIMVVPLNS